MTVTEDMELARDGDVSSLDWAAIDLPDAWPDRLNLLRPADLVLFLKYVTGFRRSKVVLPEGMPGIERIPRYVLQEFHNLPNGNYSKKITQGYVIGFDRAMLGRMEAAREEIAQAMSHCRSVLDVGCGGGRLAAALKRVGVEDVWGLDPSPYLLQYAARRNPDVGFVQGIAEDTGFAAGRFDGIATCFLFHEIPPKSFERSLEEFGRVLKPGGLLAICEPSVLQFDSIGSLLRQSGLSGVYFGCLARFVFEPFVKAWHKQDLPGQLERYGFEVIQDTDSVPLRCLLARKAD